MGNLVDPGVSLGFSLGMFHCEGSRSLDLGEIFQFRATVGKLAYQVMLSGDLDTQTHKHDSMKNGPGRSHLPHSKHGEENMLRKFVYKMVSDKLT